jgi:hypothetical protein
MKTNLKLIDGPPRSPARSALAEAIADHAAAQRQLAAVERAHKTAQEAVLQRRQSRRPRKTPRHF